MNNIETAIKWIKKLYSVMFVEGKAWELDLAIQALQEKAERQNSQPLTLKQLKERTKPVWVNNGTAGNGYWILCNKGIMVAPSGNRFDVEEITERQFYDHEPKEAHRDNEV